jgi:hypothetical protein
VKWPFPADFWPDSAPLMAFAPVELKGSGDSASVLQRLDLEAVATDEAVVVYC